MDVRNNPISKFILQNFTDSVYYVGYRFTDKNFWEEQSSSFEVLRPSIHYWYADPIPFTFDGQTYVFVEKYDRFMEIGCIAVSVINANGRMSVPRTIIDNGTHMSFPIIIAYNNCYYMMPENCATGCIEIYRMGNSPYVWEPYYTIHLDEEIVDISYIIDEEGVILIGGIPAQENPKYIRRQIIRLKNLDDVSKLQWKICFTDENASLTTRNAGNVLENNDKLFRVIQESTMQIYGRNLLLSQINHISENGLDETVIRDKSVHNVNVHLKKIVNKKIGIHTYGQCSNGFEVVDLAVAKVSIVPLLRRFRGMIRGRR